jgi:hypothetical protein
MTHASLFVHLMNEQVFRGHRCRRGLSIPAAEDAAAGVTVPQEPFMPMDSLVVPEDEDSVANLAGAGVASMLNLLQVLSLCT